MKNDDVCTACGGHLDTTGHVPGCGNAAWWENDDTKFSVADYGIEVGAFVTAVEMVRYFEKPWKWDDLHREYLHDLDARAEQQYETHCELRYEAL